jgi:AcrR family transcriptional regulator
MAVTTPGTGSPTTSARPLESDKAKRIVDAMRASVAARGAAGSTFDHVAREAGVSRGLLHYYFGTKERLLVEVVRRDAEIRLAALGALLADARTGDDFIDALVRSLEDLIERDPNFVVLMYELFTLSRRNALPADARDARRLARGQAGRGRRATGRRRRGGLRRAARARRRARAALPDRGGPRSASDAQGRGCGGACADRRRTLERHSKLRI